MLQLQRIYKQYQTGDITQLALNDVSLNFRDNEFVSILGPSGSGKTTLLNIIGGLDRYDAGNLIIDGVPTQGYTDRDWDSYRNHSVGFIFQGYNLIPHQTILANVELALNIAGVSGDEKRKRAEQALASVGLGEQLGKRPSQLSGGQQQRVAIARALVNDPQIVLADEPTGALDTETSIQVMDLLREVAKDRLVIMVTHNPELAQQYSTRIVQLRDGHIVGDTRPCPNPTQGQAAEMMGKRPPKVGMGFGSALGLSMQNLLTKKGRTLLTAFAGSIGIIGIALIIAMSSGVNDYVSNMQRDTMVSYPITIQSQAMSLDAAMEAGAQAADDQQGDKKDERPDGAVKANYEALQSHAQQEMSVKKNDLKSFKEYLESDGNAISGHVGRNGITYSYSTPFDVYSTDPNGSILDVNKQPSTGLGESADAAVADSSASSGSLIGMLASGGSTSQNAASFMELPMPDGASEPSSAITDNYDMLHGRWPQETDEVVLVAQKDGSIPASLACQIGLMPQAGYASLAQLIDDGGKPDGMSWTYDQICDARLSLVNRSDRYAKGEDGRFTEIPDEEVMTRKFLDAHSLTLHIVGIVAPKENTEVELLTTPFAYHPKLTDALVDVSNASAAVTAQEADAARSVVTGLPFGLTDDAQKAEAVKSVLLGLSPQEKASTYLMLSSARPEMFAGQQATDQQGTDAQAPQDGQQQTDQAAGDQQATDAQQGLQGVQDAIAQMVQSATGQATGQAPAAGDEGDLAARLDEWLNASPDPSLLAPLYDQKMANVTLESTLADLGKADKDSPASISIYADSFEDKDAITKGIDEYNKQVGDKAKKITYTDYVAAITGGVTGIINIVSAVLIAFVAVSLVVSCLMIGIITHISVLERTKEIGILRALGASKKNVSQVFNAETVIVGFFSGVIGVGVAALLSLPATAIIQGALKTDTVAVALPPVAALVLVGISILITTLGGIAPAHKAARQDPVVALRSE